jgi:hypothetical protein
MKAEDIGGFENILSQAEINAKTDWEMDFVSDMLEKYDEYENDMYVSERQLEILEKIAYR